MIWARIPSRSIVGEGAFGREYGKVLMSKGSEILLMLQTNWNL
jgi:hypothetical protein